MTESGEDQPAGEGSPHSGADDTTPPPRAAAPRRGSRWTVVSTVLACYITGLAVNNLATGNAAAWIDHIFPRLGRGSQLDLRSIASAWDTVQNDYVLRSVSSTVGTEGAERGIIDALKQLNSDRFSNFLSADDYSRLQQTLRGQLPSGIGIELQARCDGARICAGEAQPTVVTIEAVLHDQPAERAGLRNGDILLRVDGQAVSSLSSDISTRIDRTGALIRGQKLDASGAVISQAPAGTQVTLTVQRGSTVTDVTVTRANLQIPSVFSGRLGGTLYLQVTGFDENTGSAARSALRSGLDGGATSIVLDLRGNPGGLVSEAQTLASQFLVRVPGREEDVVVRRGRLASADNPASATTVEHDTIQDGGVAPTQRLAVIVDGDSASAAEIVSAALADYHRATLVGQRTFGKGSVQEDFPLPDGSDLHLTVEKWFGPDGESIDNVGIAPDRVVALADADHRYRLDAQGAAPSADAQLQAALAAVR